MSGKPLGVLERVLDAAARRPDAPALTDLTTSTSYAELVQRARAVAGHLRDLGVHPGQRVGVEVARTPTSVALILGVLMAGAAWVPLDPAAPLERRVGILTRARCIALVCADGVDSELRQLPVADPAGGPGAGRAAVGRMAVTQASAALAGSPAGVAPPGSDLPTDSDFPIDSDLAYVLFTSGSTGEPKGVEVTHGNLAAVLDWSCAVLDEQDVARFASCISFTFDPSVIDVFTTLARGGCLTVLRDALDPALEDSRATALSMTPSALRELTRAGRLPASLRTALVGGEVLETAVAQAFLAEHPGARILHCYGPTETTVTVLAQELRAGSGGVSLGRELPGVLAYVVDQDLRPTRDGEPGELLIGGPQVSRGYTGDLELTAQRFVSWTAPDGEVLRVYRTGDRVRRDPDGDLHFLGRSDRQVKVRGYRVELGDIEAALGRLPGVGQAVAAMDGSGAAARLVAWVAPVADPPDAELLREGLRDLLPAALVPALVNVVDAMPLTSSGKVDTGALLASLRASAVTPMIDLTGTTDLTGLAEGPDGPSLSPAEREVAAVVVDVAALHRLPHPDDLLLGDLGVTSLQLVEVISRLERDRGVRLAARSLTDTSIGDLARTLGAGAAPRGGWMRRWRPAAGRRTPVVTGGGAPAGGAPWSAP